MIARRYLTTDQIASTWGWPSRDAVRKFCARHGFPLKHRGRIRVAEAREFELFIEGFPQRRSFTSQLRGESRHTLKSVVDVHAEERSQSVAGAHLKSFEGRS